MTQKIEPHSLAHTLRIHFDENNAELLRLKGAGKIATKILTVMLIELYFGPILQKELYSSRETRLKFLYIVEMTMAERATRRPCIVKGYPARW
jgi:hypothetical protein